MRLTRANGCGRANRFFVVTSHPVLSSAVGSYIVAHASFLCLHPSALHAMIHTPRICLRCSARPQYSKACAMSTLVFCCIHVEACCEPCFLLGTDHLFTAYFQHAVSCLFVGGRDWCRHCFRTYQSRATTVECTCVMILPEPSAQQ